MLRKHAFAQLWHCAAPATAQSTARHVRLMATVAAQGPKDTAATFMNGTNAGYAEEMYKAWRQDPQSVHVSWRAYFSGLDGGVAPEHAFQPPPNLFTVPQPAGGSPSLHVSGQSELTDHLKVRPQSFPSLEKVFQT